ncbi:MAG: hypothetical protein K0Q95_3270 [Bacteroidota bacterium]|jgi:acyl carrier protein phosphodiesterase|nr:hypothetical protein [Bacteroidota bacterium]
MNFLSHIFLSGEDEGLIIGNFIADSVKGSDFLKYPEEIQKGIILHRKIDTFTDTHPVVDESKERLRSEYHKYSSVIVDVYYDHFLAANFDQYSVAPLNDFVQNVYRIIQQHHHHLPLKSSHFTQYMLRYNILEEYARLDGIEQVLKGMSQRAKFESKMERSIIELKEHYSLFEAEFQKFFPDLQEYVNKEIRIL